MQAASTEFVADGVDPSNALPEPTPATSSSSTSVPSSAANPLRREPVGVDAADRGEVLGGLLGAVDQVGLAVALDLAEREGGLPLVDALRA